MTTNTDEPRQILIRRLLAAQILLIAVGTVFVLVPKQLAQAVGLEDVGFFWPSFLVGCLGASVALLNRINLGDSRDHSQISVTWFTTVMPILYGGLMAMVAYGFFLSGILSGDGGDGLLSTNLFPNFTVPPSSQSEGVSMNTFLKLRPKTTKDIGKLLVWCFLAGYSETFVTGMLNRIEQNSSVPEA